MSRNCTCKMRLKMWPKNHVTYLPNFYRKSNFVPVLKEGWFHFKNGLKEVLLQSQLTVLRRQILWFQLGKKDLLLLKFLHWDLKTIVMWFWTGLEVFLAFNWAEGCSIGLCAHVCPLLKMSEILKTNIGKKSELSMKTSPDYYGQEIHFAF